MKKKVIAFLAGIALLFVSIFVLIPNVIRFNRLVLINITQDGIYRNFLNNKDWSNWWPGAISPGKDDASALKYTYKNKTYHVISNGNNDVVITVNGKNFKAATSLNVIPKKTDSVFLNWDAVIPTSFNPIKRVQLYLSSRELNKEMGIVLEHIQTYYSNPQNIYHIKIQHELVKDSLLVSTFNESKLYPTNEDIYQLVSKLRNYIASQSAIETGFPMLNIIQRDGAKWITKVAIPVNKTLDATPDITFKKMLGLGMILMTEVNGGPGTIKNATDEMENYVNDYHYSSPAIPFQSLVTDRTNQKDTSLWKTRIYYPVMY